MKEENVLNVLIYLFKNHMQENCELDMVQAKLLTKLEELGFRRKVINQAFDWLDKLAAHTRPSIELPQKSSLRVFSEYECEILDIESRGLIMALEQQGILNPITRELVMNQALELELMHIDASLLKWVILMVLFNQPNEELALACIEFLVLDDTIGGLQ